MDDIQKSDQQYFPTYTLSNDASDVALKEYDLSAASLASEEKTLSLSTSLLVGFIGVFAALLDKDFVDGAGKILSSDSNKGYLAPSLIITSLIVFSVASYFADARRSVVNASRKIVILRRMLGLSYGNIELILPSKRIEGANEPYHIRMFHGWISPKAIPLYCIAVSSSVFIWTLLGFVSDKFEYLSFTTLNYTASFWLSIIWGFCVVVFYRVHLLDQYETTWRVAISGIAPFLGQRLVDNFEYVLYRARLSRFEADRLNIPIDIVAPILVALEDRRFYQHRGVSVLSVGRALWAKIRYGKASGASTITQQLSRTLFIKRLTRTFRRKIVEIGLAIWLDRQFDKSELIDIYICSVRYETKIFGIIAALRYFFPDEDIKAISPAKAFFLVERVSNIKSGLLVSKVIENIAHLRKTSLLSACDIDELVDIFELQRRSGRLKCDQNDILRIAKKFDVGGQRLMPRDGSENGAA